MKVLIGPNPMGLEDALEELGREFPEVTFEHCAERDNLAQALADAEVYVGWLGRDQFLAAKKLKWIQSPSSGINYYFDIPEFVTSDVVLTSASGTHGACLAESVLGMILAFTRGIRDCILYQPDRDWAGGRTVRPRLVELTGSTMGIVGFGRVGKAIAERAVAFGMRVVAVDLLSQDKPEHLDELWGVDRLGDLMKVSDYVVVTVPYTPQTVGLLGAKELALLKPTAMVVGISRGGVIDQDALVDALRDRRLAAAALDVFKPEPLPDDSELWALDNVLITPHIAGGTQFEGQYVLEILRENLGRFLRGESPLRNQADKARRF